MDAKYFDSIAESLSLSSVYLLPIPFGLAFGVWGFFDGEGMISRLERIWDGFYHN